MSLALPRRGSRRIRVARGSLESTGPPFDAVLALDTGRHAVRHAAALALALSAHGLLVVAVLFQHVDGDAPTPLPHQEIVATLEAAPRPPPLRASVPDPQPREPSRSRSRGPPAPAQAGRVLAQATDRPADLTGFDIAVGTGESYAGGATSSTGTSKVAASSEARPLGTGVGSARAAMPSASDWACPWPEEAQDSDQLEARVTIRAQVGIDGRALHVDVLSAPPGGFAEAARECVAREFFHPALDRSGHAVSGSTPPITVHFVR